MQIKEFYDQRTNTFTYIVYDENSKDAVIIDPVLDFDPASGKIWDESVQLVLNFLQQKNLKAHWVLETHAHADHLTGAQKLKKQIPGLKIAIGSQITEVQKIFKPVFNLEHVHTDGKPFDRLLKDMEKFEVGALKIEVRHTPGHTPACAVYLIGDALFVGDAIFMPDSGTGRCDFPAGSAEKLYESVTQKIYSLPDNTRIFVGHDYQPGGRAVMFQTTVGEQKQKNIQLKGSTTKEEFVDFRKKRDATLAAPRLLLPSIQVNIDAGILPPAESNGLSYLKIPLREK